MPGPRQRQPSRSAPTRHGQARGRIVPAMATVREQKDSQVIIFKVYENVLAAFLQIGALHE